MNTVVPTANRPIIAAARARPLSKPLTVGTITMGAGRGAAGTEEGTGRGAAGAAVDARGAGAAAGAACAAGAAVNVGAGAAAAGAAGPPGGNVGNLMVGAAEGLGGKLIRTVSFLG